jgi:hypothetical protein
MEKNIKAQPQHSKGYFVMDDVTKIIIATISGFIVAFFAEPVKLYFQNKQRRDVFRFALYAEIYNNYRLLSTFIKVYKENDPDEIKDFLRARSGIRSGWIAMPACQTNIRTYITRSKSLSSSMCFIRI